MEDDVYKIDKVLTRLAKYEDLQTEESVSDILDDSKILKNVEENGKELEKDDTLDNVIEKHSDIKTNSVHPTPGDLSKTKSESTKQPQVRKEPSEKGVLPAKLSDKDIESLEIKTKDTEKKVIGPIPDNSSEPKTSKNAK